MDKVIPDDITPEERAELQKMRSERKILTVLEPILEQRRCQQWGISYDEDNPAPHRLALGRIDTALREMVDQHDRNWKRLWAAGRAVGAGSASVGRRLWDVLMGAIVLLVLGWLATRMGIKLPGVP